MKTNDEPWSCDDLVERLEALVDGELTAVEQTRADGHLVECEACEGKFLQAASVRRSLSELPSLRCPPSVMAAAEREHRNGLRATWLGMPRWAAASLALAASIALIRLVVEERPNINNAAITEGQRTEQALVELQETLQTQATSVGRKTFEHSVAKPTRIVLAAVSESPLGRWSAKAASLFASPDTAPTDAT